MNLSSMKISLFLSSMVIYITGAAMRENEDTDQDNLMVDIHRRIRVGNGYLRQNSWREPVEFGGGSNRMAEQRRRTRDRFNFYNIQPPVNQQQQQQYQPYNPYNPYNSYDDAEDLYQPPNYPPSPQPPVYPLVYPPQTTTTTTTTTTPSPPPSPIGYMLIDTYTSKFGSYSRPTAFFVNS